MKFRKFIAFAVVTTMVLANTVTAFADEGITGAGTIEYDDSKDILYDSVTVPTLAEDDYAFTIDAQGLMSSYGNTKYKSGSTVYFKSVKLLSGGVYEENIKAATGKTLYTASYAAKAKDAESTDAAPTWSGVVTGHSGTGDEISYTIAANTFFVWVPDSLYVGKSVSGSYGKYVALTSDNITNWFEVSDGNVVSRKADYMAEPNVCDGKIYQISYTAVADAGITTTDANPVSKYYKVDGDTVTINDLYSSNTGTLATKDDIVYTEPTLEYNNETKHVYVTNKSTKDKTLTIDVTLKNAGSLGIATSNDFTSDTTASMWTAIFYTNTGNETGPTTLANAALQKDAETGKVSRKIEVALAAAVDNGVTTYQTEEKNEITHGHVYKRYSGPNPTYTSAVFYLQAKANSSATATTWDDYYATLTAADKVPEYNIVYTIKNDDNSETGPEESGSESGSGNGSGSGSQTVEHTEGQASIISFSGTAYLALLGENGATFSKDATSVIVNGKDVTSGATRINGYVTMTAAVLTDAGVTVASGTALNATYVVDGVTYTASVTPGA